MKLPAHLTARALALMAEQDQILRAMAALAQYVGTAEQVVPRAA